MTSRAPSSDAAPPIIIVGCPRSGTLLAARVIGGCRGHFLVTEHSKKSVCPEDRSGVVDSHLWWAGFRYAHWNQAAGHPDVETPVHDAAAIARLRGVYRALADGQRLVIKNPSHLTRIPVLREMFPEARYVFCVRNPWHTIQSIAIKAVVKDSFLLRSARVRALPPDPLLRAAASWAEAVETFETERDERWTALRYEDLLAAPAPTVATLFAFLGIDDADAAGRAASLPSARAHNYYFLQRLFRRSAHAEAVIELLRPGCEAFGYAPSIESVPGNAVAYFSERLRRRLARLVPG